MPDTPGSISMTPIGHVRGGRREATKDGWGSNRCRLELDPARFTPDSLRGVEELSHVEVLFYFHVDAHEPTETARATPGPQRLARRRHLRAARAHAAQPHRRVHLPRAGC